MSLDFRKIISVASKVSKTGDGLQLSPWLKAGGQIPVRSSYEIREEDPELLHIKYDQDNERFLKIVTLKVGDEEQKKELTIADLTRKKKVEVKIKDQFTIELPKLDLLSKEIDIPLMPSVSKNSEEQNQISDQNLKVKLTQNQSSEKYEVGKIKNEKEKRDLRKVFYQGRVNIFNVVSPGIYDEDKDEFEGSYIKLSAYDDSGNQLLEQFILLPQGDFAARFAEDLAPGKIDIEIFAGSYVEKENLKVNHPPFHADFYLRRMIK